jgi:cytochrome c553
MIEKFYIFLTRWFTLIATTIAFLTVILGSLYALKLYYQSQDTAVQAEPYRKQLPQIEFDAVKKIEEAKLQEFAKVRDYVVGGIDKGSRGHGYAIAEMPAGLVKDRNQTYALANYVAGGMTKNPPAAFSTCAKCHGQDGQGMRGQAPDLTVLPIYHGMRQRVITPRQALEENRSALKERTPAKPPKSDREKQIDRIGSHLNRYAMYVEQPGISREDLDRLLTVLADGLSEEETELYLHQLEVATKRLLEYGKGYPIHDPTALPPIDWREFLDDFTRSFKGFLEEERQKARAQEERLRQEILAKEMRALQARSQLSQLGIVIGIAILIFLVLTIVLVLLKIERNTRRGKERQAEIPASPVFPSGPKSEGGKQ